MLIKVDLPAPFGPNKPNIDPLGISRLIPFRASTGCRPRGEYTFLKSSVRIAQSGMGTAICGKP